MSRLRGGTCGEPGPYDTHCTEQPGHDYSCNDAGEDSSWNDRFPEDWQTETPHACGDARCAPHAPHKPPQPATTTTPSEAHV